MNKNISTLIVDSSTSRAFLLKRALQENGYGILESLKTADNLLAHIDQHQPDIIIVSIELPDASTLKKIANVHRERPLPIVMFAEKDTPQIIQQAIKAGVTAFIVDDLQPQRLNSIINVALVRFQEQQGLRNELERTKNKLAERKILEQAKGLLMQQKGISESKAYQSLRTMAMDKGLSLVTVAENIIDVLSLLDDS